MSTHDDVMKWNHFPRYWPFVREIHRSLVNSPHKGQLRGALMFPLVWAVWYKRLSKQSWGWWFETPPCSLWRHRNAPVAFLDPCIINFTVGVWNLISVRHWLYVSLICMHHFVKIRIRIYNIAYKDYKYHYQSNTVPKTHDMAKHKTKKMQ